MEKDVSVFFSLDMDTEKKIYVAGDFSLDITGHSDIPC